MKKYFIFCLFLASLVRVYAQDIQLDFDLTETVVEITSNDLDVVGTITNNGSLPIVNDIKLAYNLDLTELAIPPVIITVVDTVNLLTPLGPGEQIPYIYDVSPLSPFFNYTVSVQNIITIWPVNALQQIIDSTIFFRDSVFVVPDGQLDTTNIAPDEIDLCANVLLEGSFNPFSTLPNDQMRTVLRQQNLIPLNQPYDAEPWNYQGQEGFGSLLDMPLDMADWVLVRLKDAFNPGVVIGQAAGILLSDTKITDTNGNELTISLDEVLPFYVEVIHRNHMTVYSSEIFSPISDSCIVWDFTSGMDQAYSKPGLDDDPQKAMTALTGTYYCMQTGNAQNIDCLIDTNDLLVLFLEYGANFVYSRSDTNLDGINDLNDVNLIIGNYNENCDTP